MRTLLMAIALIVLAIGGARWWYDARIGEYERQKQIFEQHLHPLNVSALLDYTGPSSLENFELFDRPVFWRYTEAYCEDVCDEDFSKAIEQLGLLVDLDKLLVLGRQIVPQARTAQSGEANSVIEALRRHPTLRQVVVDASIRGTPAEFEAPIYTREDLALLEELLPNVEIQWIEVN
jgi:hypothetical protein